MLEVKNRAATTRSGIYSGDGWKLPVPNVLFPESERLEAPGYAGAVLGRDDSGLFIDVGGKRVSLPPYSGVPAGYTLKGCDVPHFEKKGRVAVIKPEISDYDIAELGKRGIDFFILENALELYQNPRRLVECMFRIREGIGYQSLLYLPGVATPQNMSLLFYLGADLLDATQVVFLTRDRKFLASDGMMDYRDVDPGSCACRGCDMDASENEKLMAHNMLAMQTELAGIRGRIASRGVRQFTEYRAKTAPELVSMLRLLDHEFPDFEEKRFPVTGPEFKATTRLSIDRPDVKRFRERVLTRYWKPESTDILVILPCSARKPYSKSRSHQSFREAIRNSGRAHRVHELIITSPLGLVPRELELTYPAQHYDIPVTGFWYEDEKKMLNVLLKEYLAINRYEHVIVHFEEGVIEVPKGADQTCVGHPASAESLASLQEALTSICDIKSKPDWKKRSLEELANLARFMWGEEATEIFEGCSIRGRYPRQRIFLGKEQLAIVSDTSGFLVPTLELGKMMAERELYWVRQHEFDLVGNLFAVGVENADSRIRVGDEVCIIGNKGLVATGTAKMNADEMMESNRGEAVRVRHKVKQG